MAEYQKQGGFLKACMEVEISVHQAF